MALIPRLNWPLHPLGRTGHYPKPEVATTPSCPHPWTRVVAKLKAAKSSWLSLILLSKPEPISRQVPLAASRGGFYPSFSLADSAAAASSADLSNSLCIQRPHLCTDIIVVLTYLTYAFRETTCGKWLKYSLHGNKAESTLHVKHTVQRNEKIWKVFSSFIDIYVWTLDQIA